VSAQHCNSSAQRTSKQAWKMVQLVTTYGNSTFSALARKFKSLSSGLLSPPHPANDLHCPAHSPFTQAVYMASNDLPSSLFPILCLRRDRALGHSCLIPLQHQDYRPQRTLQIFKVLIFNLCRCYFCILPVTMSSYFHTYNTVLLNP